MSFTRQAAREYARNNIARICADQGTTVALTDPTLIAYTAEMLRVGKRQLHPVRVENLPRR